VKAAKASGPIRRFFREWLQFDRAVSVGQPADFHHPSALVNDTERWIEMLLSEHLESGFLTTFFTGRRAAVSPETAPNYDLPDGQVSQPTFVELPNRSGILAQPAWLSAWARPDGTDPIRRGRFIREHFLCLDIPEVDIEDIEPLPDSMTETMRERLVAHTDKDNCRGCHALFDPMGLGIEELDHYGRLRTQEAGRPIVTTGELVGSDRDGDFVGHQELAEKLEASETARDCFVTRLSEFLWGRRLSSTDERLVTEAAERFGDSRQDLSALFSDLLSSDAFVMRDGKSAEK
jgi:hypothetical protein